jgi:hypothetical protein
MTDGLPFHASRKHRKKEKRQVEIKTDKRKKEQGSIPECHPVGWRLKFDQTDFKKLGG